MRSSGGHPRSRERDASEATALSLTGPAAGFLTDSAGSTSLHQLSPQP